MRGRASGSPEMARAADWIASQYEESELVPLTGHNGFIHDYAFQTRSGQEIRERNVIGILEGNNPALKDEYILITAHFDHVGVRRPVNGDSIYNGADDNAAGTCTLLGIARTIKEKRLKPGRSIIFAAVSAEEMGMKGSGHIAANPPFPLENVFVNMNFEMTGHSEFLGRGNYYMTGCDYSNLDEIIKEMETGILTIILLIPYQLANRLFYMSDNASFARVEREGETYTGIPGATFATTTFADYIHSPADEAGLFDFVNMAGLVDHFTGIILFLSETGKKVDWTDDRFTRLM
ncbi:MAG: M28 family peptidase [Bacteroidales bacterium]|nr:M28 family peptidase [Bacteroidales bacterium]